MAPTQTSNVRETNFLLQIYKLYFNSATVLPFFVNNGLIPWTPQESY